MSDALFGKCVYRIANEATTQSSVTNTHHHYLDAHYHLYIFTLHMSITVKVCGNLLFSNNKHTAGIVKLFLVAHT